MTKPRAVRHLRQFSTALALACWVGLPAHAARPADPLTVSVPEAAATKTILYAFTGGADGGEPRGVLLREKDGTLFGTTYRGGDMGACSGIGCGTVFSLSPPAAGQTAWNLSVLASFVGVGDAAAPAAGLTLGAGGYLYGTTLRGGGTGCGGYGCGTAFRLKPPKPGETGWTVSIIWRFSGADGASPQSEVTIDPQGRLLGTTAQGGPNDQGTIFRLVPPPPGVIPWTVETLHAFTGGPVNGGTPYGPVTLDADGNLFGTTRYGGLHGGGTIFMLAPQAVDGAWRIATLHEFRGGTEGGYPTSSLTQDDNGTFYGTATNVAYTLAPPTAPGGRWTYSILHRFASFGDVNVPYAGLTELKTANSTTWYGTGGYGADYRFGGVFKLVPPSATKANWTEGKVYQFGAGSTSGLSPDGAVPFAGITLGTQGALYGATIFGGDTANCDVGCGTVFVIQP